MNAQTPRIAIPEPTSTDEAYNQRSLPQYLRAVEAAGGVPVPIPLQASSETQSRLLATCSAILLPGSPADVDPARYGQPVAKECAAKDAPREAADELLFEDAFSTGKPILGICYGLQSLNVWRHGTLIQHLPHADLPHAEQQGNGNHVNHQPGREVQTAHAVVLAADSRLSRVLGQLPQEAPDLCVNSSHHQAIDRPGDGLAVVATSPVDGVIEALEGTDPKQFVVAVQWHPERSYESSAASRALFAAFLDAARSWASSAETR
jgi:putative glutamine amidotransferase